MAGAHQLRQHGLHARQVKSSGYKRGGGAAVTSPVLSKALSLAEMMDFESGRRFRNPYWVIAMAAEASPEKLQREMVFMQAYSNELQLQNLRMMEKVGVALGQLLAAQTRVEMRPSIEAQLLRAQSTNAR